MIIIAEICIIDTVTTIIHRIVIVIATAVLTSANRDPQDSSFKNKKIRAS